MLRERPFLSGVFPGSIRSFHTALQVRQSDRDQESKLTNAFATDSKTALYQNSSRLTLLYLIVRATLHAVGVRLSCCHRRSVLGATFHISYNRARDLTTSLLSADRQARSETDHASANPSCLGCDTRHHADSLRIHQKNQILTSRLRAARGRLGACCRHLGSLRGAVSYPPPLTLTGFTPPRRPSP